MMSPDSSDFRSKIQFTCLNGTQVKLFRELGSKGVGKYEYILDEFTVFAFSNISDKIALRKLVLAGQQKKRAQNEGML